MAFKYHYSIEDEVSGTEHSFKTYSYDILGEDEALLAKYEATIVNQQNQIDDLKNQLNECQSEG